MFINNTILLPYEIVGEILLRTDCHHSLNRVCKCFFNHFAEAFWENCSQNPLLQERAYKIQILYSPFSCKQKIQAIYSSLLQDVDRIPLKKKDGRKEILKQALSFTKFYQLENWLKDINLIQLFEKIADQKDYAKTFLESLQKKTTAKKANNIRAWLFSYEEDLGTIHKLNLMDGSEEEIKEYQRKVKKFYYPYPYYTFTIIPAEIALLPNLKKLSCHHNRLVKLPVEMTRLSQLQKLYFNHNQLTHLPKTVIELSQLKIIYFNHNQLTSLPAPISRLIHLKELHFDDNQLTRLPEEVLELKKLEVIHLNYNQLTTLPTTIGRLTLLKELHLEHNQLTHLPEDVIKLTKLKELHLSFNQLTSLPKGITQLTQLDNLTVSSNINIYLPPGIQRLKGYRGYSEGYVSGYDF